ncbi:hypothetical protein MFU01_48300 [Myxococcus fulvus]|uniref:Uncharacterized protein n=1 Tax=Myxococcus fulvus TaxID=33 RepID=A0A511T851_MYXFU|nr:hypothetical protein MFU01_48300 [Myxococcus fulvus]
MAASGLVSDVPVSRVSSGERERAALGEGFAGEVFTEVAGCFAPAGVPRAPLLFRGVESDLAVVGRFSPRGALFAPLLLRAVGSCRAEKDFAPPDAPFAPGSFRETSCLAEACFAPSAAPPAALLLRGSPSRAEEEDADFFASFGWERPFISEPRAWGPRDVVFPDEGFPRAGCFFASAPFFAWAFCVAVPSRSEGERSRGGVPGFVRSPSREAAPRWKGSFPRTPLAISSSS